MLTFALPYRLAKSIIYLFIIYSDKIGAKSAKQKLKLLNLNHIASQRKENYSGRLLDDTKVKDWTLTLVTSSDGKLSKLVVDSLANFLPPKKYLTLSCQQESGVFVGKLKSNCFKFIRLKS